MTLPTYAPNPIITKKEVFEWSDYAGRYLNMRLLDEGRKGVNVATADSAARFRISGPTDTLEFLDALGDWATEQAIVLRLSL